MTDTARTAPGAFLILVARAETKVAGPYAQWTVDQPTVRLYRASPDVIALQIRTFGSTSETGKAKRAAYSHAPLSRGDAIMLRDALSDLIDDTPA